MYLKSLFFVMCSVLIIIISANNDQDVQAYDSKSNEKSLKNLDEDIIKILMIAVEEGGKLAPVIMEKIIKLIELRYELSSKMEMNKELIELSKKILSRNKIKIEL